MFRRGKKVHQGDGESERVISDSGFKGIGPPSWVAPTQGEAVCFGQSFAVAHFALAFGGDFGRIVSV